MTVSKIDTSDKTTGFDFAKDIIEINKLITAHVKETLKIKELKGLRVQVELSHKAKKPWSDANTFTAILQELEERRSDSVLAVFREVVWWRSGGQIKAIKNFDIDTMYIMKIHAVPA
ncbi:MAG TPA: hypothetical protein VHQ20_02045 [Patescibacteria group bacterium]|jgi:hypothetical protein|nr:hypothetical protein [Patescibacteria group bacterium]